MVGWHHQLNGHEFEQALGVGDGQGSLACCSPWGHKESNMIERLNWTEWYAAHRHVEPRPGHEGWRCWLLLSFPPTHQKNVHELTRPSLNNYYKTSYHFPHGNTWFWGHWFSVACFVCKVIKIFFSTSPKTLVSKSWFDTSTQRSWAFSITIVSWVLCLAPGRVAYFMTL